MKRLPVLYLIEDNQYAISVPVEVQTAGGSISKLVANYPSLHIEECDGTDPLESYAALGRVDGFWEMDLHPWDTAAGTVILEEAGGRITDFSGGPFSVYGKQIIASNGRIHDQMVAVLRELN